VTELFVTPHAIQRYRERVENVSPLEVDRRLNELAFIRAAFFGAPFVKLGGGQRVVIKDWQVITVLPSDHMAGSLDRRRDHLFE